MPGTGTQQNLRNFEANRLLGHCPELAVQSAFSRAEGKPHRRPRRAAKGQGTRRQERTRTRLYRRDAGILFGRRKDDVCYPNDDEAQIAYAITLNVTAPPESLTDRETDRRHVRFLANI